MKQKKQKIEMIYFTYSLKEIEKAISKLFSSSNKKHLKK